MAQTQKVVSEIHVSKQDLYFLVCEFDLFCEMYIPGQTVMTHHRRDASGNARQMYSVCTHVLVAMWHASDPYTNVLSMQEDCVQVFFEPTAAVHKHDSKHSKLFYVKKKPNTTHRLLLITVRGIHIWNGLASDITQLLRLQQFKKRLVDITFFVFMNE